MNIEVELEQVSERTIAVIDQEAIREDKSPDATQAPEFYESGREHAWAKTATLEHWYAFYKGTE